MGSSVGVLGTDRRSKAIVTQVRQENVRLQARVERLSAEASQLRAEISTLLKEKQMRDLNDGIGTSTLRLNSPAGMSGKYEIFNTNFITQIPMYNITRTG